jgi:hypothetical protein
LKSLTNLEIARLTTKVSQLTWFDSDSTTTIAADTLTFLPETFTSVSIHPNTIPSSEKTLLSTVFFDFGDENTAVSQDW